MAEVPPRAAPSARPSGTVRLRRRHHGRYHHRRRATVRAGRFRAGGLRSHERHRLLRWTAAGVGTLIVLVLLVGAAGWFYLDYKIDQLPRVAIQPGLLQQAKPGAPYDVLLVAGSDESKRADLVLLVRVVPASHAVDVLAVPSDLLVRIPGHVAGVSGTGQLGDAAAGGLSLLVQAVETSLGLPIEHVVAISTGGFQRMVDAIGGIYLDFPMPVIDQTSGLHVSSTGCQQVGGAEAVQLTETGTPYYFSGSSWHRQDAVSSATPGTIGLELLVALIDRARPSFGNPLGVDDLVRVASGNVQVDTAWSAGALRGAASQIAGVPLSGVGVEALPAVTGHSSGGGAAEVLAQPYAATALADFLAGGSASRTTAATGRSSVPWTPAACSP